MNYPRIIHQTYKNHNIPDEWKLSKDMWQLHHPNYTYMFWTDNDIRNYIQTNYPEYLELHDNYKYNIQRADMIRYFILHDFGGIYSDLDLYPIENIENHILNYNADVLLCKSGNVGNILTNSFMISKQYSPIWKQIQSSLKHKKPFFAIGRHMTVMYTTGPIFISKIFEKNKSSFQLLPSEKFMAYSANDDFSVKKEKAIIMPLNGQSWNSIDSLLVNLIHKHRSELTNLVLKEQTKSMLSRSLFDKSFIGEFICSVQLEGLNEFETENIQNMENITIKYLTENKSNLIISYDHKNMDALNIIKNISNQELNNISLNNLPFEKYVLYAIQSKKNLKQYITNKFLKEPFLNYKTTELVYDYFNVPLIKLKESMHKHKDILHMTSYLFTLLVYSFWQLTKASFIKCSNIYYIPFIEGNNKILDYVFFVNIDNKNNFDIFIQIYEQIYKNNKTINEMWGLNILLNIGTNYLNDLIQTNKKELLISSDIVFTNIPIKTDSSKIQFVYKSSQPEKLYCICFGNKFDEVMFSLIYDKSINGIQDLFKNNLLIC